MSHEPSFPARPPPRNAHLSVARRAELLGLLGLPWLWLKPGMQRILSTGESVLGARLGSARARQVIGETDMDRQQRRQFVRDHRTCIFGYGRQADGPAMTVVYYIMDGDDMLVSTMAQRAKAKAVSRNPKVSLCVLDENWPVAYLQVYGTAVLEEDEEQAADLLRQVVELMAGQPVPDERREQIAKLALQEQRVVLRVTPYATFATPPRHVNQMDDLDTLTHWTSASEPW
jgi:PPOX class probable F420-dependent enzyme